MSIIAVPSSVLILGLVIYFRTFFIAYVISAFIRLALVIVAARKVRQKTRDSRQRYQNEVSHSWRFSPRFTNVVFGTAGRFLSIKHSLSYWQNPSSQDSSHSLHPISPTAGSAKAKCCVTQVKLECFRITSTHVLPFSTTPTTLSSIRSALLELALRDIAFRVHVTIQILDDKNEPKGSAFLRLFNRTEKRNCVTVSWTGELTIRLVQIFLFHPRILSNMISKISGYLTGHTKGSQTIKTPFSVLSNLIPALDVHGLTLKSHLDVDYPPDWMHAEGAIIDTVIRVDEFSLRMPDLNDGSDSRVELGLPHQLVANAKEQPSDILSGIKNLHGSIMTQLKQSGMNNNAGSDVSIPSLLLKMHMQQKRNLTSYLASVELSGDRIDTDSMTPIPRKSDIAFISISTGSCQIMSAFVILRRTYKPILVEFDAMRPSSGHPRDGTMNISSRPVKKSAISVVLFRSSLGVRVGLDDDRKSPLRLTLASLINLHWSKKESGVIRSQMNHSEKLTKFEVKELCLGHQRLEGNAFQAFKLDQLCVDIETLEPDLPHPPLENPLNHSGASSKYDLNASIGTISFHVYDPRFIEDFFRFVGSFYSALAFTRLGPASSSVSPSKKGIEGRRSLDHIEINLKVLDIYVAMAVNYDERASQETILFAMSGSDGVLSIAPSKTENRVHGELTKAKNTWINFSYFECSLEFTPHESLPKFMATEPTAVKEKHRIQFDVSGSGLKIFIAPKTNAHASLASTKQGSRVDIMINSLAFKEKVVDSQGVQNTIILKSNGLSSLAFRSSEISQNYPSELETRSVSVLDIFIDFYGTALNVTWSPVLQWLILSAIDKVESTLSRFKPSLDGKREEIKKRKHTNTNIRTNETGVYARLVLTGGSTIDICTSSMVLLIGKENDACWNKANICLDVADTRAYFNCDLCEVLTVSSFHYSDCLRRATAEEVLNYKSKCDNDTNIMDDVVVGDDGSPLMERVNIDIGEFAEFKLSQSLHFGMVTEDLSSFMKIMEEGLRISGLEKKVQSGYRKYQLMEIKASLKYIDAVFFEQALDHRYCSINGARPNDRSMGELFIPRLNCNSSRDNLLERLRIHISRLDCQIIRNTPRAITQENLINLDEDKSRRRVYGPVIQGGDFNLTVGQLHAILHPLSIATPILTMDTFRVNGLLYLTGLNPLSSEVRCVRDFFIPVLCHHGKSPARDQSPSKNSCPCSYGMRLHSSGIPIKIYHDLTITCEVLHMAYGSVMTSAIPKLLLITKRLVPTPCVSQYPPSDRAASLSWWDNLRYQFHGHLNLTSEHFSFLWLLDSALRFDRGLEVKSDFFSLGYNSGQFKLSSESFQVVLPGISYHIMRSRELKNAEQKEPGIDHSLPSSQIYERHPLVLIPFIYLDVSFKWVMTSEYAINSSAHHCPYLISEIYDELQSNDIFHQFRSHGLFLAFKLVMKPSIKRPACWLSLRADILPWLAHKYEAPYNCHEQINLGDDDDKVMESNKATPDILGVEVAVNAEHLHVTTWFDESGDANVDSFGSSDTIHVTVPSFRLHFMNDMGKEVTLLGPIRAIKLNNTLINTSIDKSDFDEISMYDIYALSRPCDLASTTSFTKSFETCKIIDIHQGQAEQAKSFDYILIVDQLDARNQSLDELRTLAPEHLALERSSRRGKAPWTVLVSGLKLLWTLEIRYSVVSIVQDLLFAINFVNVNRRGTAQILDQSETVNDLYNSDEPRVTTLISPNDSNSSAGSYETKYSFSSDHPISHLDYLLNTSTSDQDVLSSNESNPTHKKWANFAKYLFSSQLINRESSIRVDESVPRFDIHLSNPQIQLHSEGTGGGVILAMRAAFVEGRRFVHLFTKTSNSLDTTADSLLHRTDNLYTLHMMEIYSIKPSHRALEWLHMIDTTNIRSDEQPTFLPQLRLYEPQSFAASDRFTKIMEHSTFKTLQICYSPPVEFTREELEDVIQSNLIKNLDTHNGDDEQVQGTEEYIEIAIDKLSFLLDSYQFTTTLDVIRNVLLEPPKQPRPRFYRSLIKEMKEEKKKDFHGTLLKSSRLKASSAAMADMLKKVHRSNRQLQQYHVNKKDRELLQQKAHTLLEDLDDAQYMSHELSLRRIKWSLSKVKWKIDNSSFDDRVTIDFTGFTGYHDFPKEGGIHSQLSLEDLNISSEKPSQEAAHFSYSSSIVRTIVGVERSPCERCEKPFNRSNNEANSCIFHPGLLLCSVNGEYRYTCCGAASGASGCQAGFHTGKERALLLRLDAFPRVVKGLTMYRHVEGNIFPGVPHTLVLQLTKALAQLLNNYFFVDGSDGFSKTSDTVSDRSSEMSEINHVDTDVRDIVPVKRDSGTTKRNLPSKEATEKNKGDLNKIDATVDIKGDPDKSDATVELYFMKYWRLGEINLNISIAGFGKYRNITDLGLSVSSFQAAYKLGSAQHLVKLLKSHILMNLASIGLEKIRDKISGKVRRRMLDFDEEDEDEESKDNKQDHVTLLLGTPKK